MLANFADRGRQSVCLRRSAPALKVEGLNDNIDALEELIIMAHRFQSPRCWRLRCRSVPSSGLLLLYTDPFLCKTLTLCSISILDIQLAEPSMEGATFR